MVVGLLGMLQRGGQARTADTSAVVTGAGSGIGRAFALELARRGGRVVVSDISEARAEETVALIEAAGGHATAVVCDVALVDDVVALAKAAREWLGEPVDFVVNNAGVGIGGTAVGVTDIGDWQWALGVNLWGVVHGCHVFAPGLRELGRGSIINVASAASFAAAPGMGPYNVGKAAVLSLSETLAAELAGTGVRVSVLCPTFVQTNITVDGRISEGAQGLAGKLMRWTGISADSVVATTLDAHDRGALYVVPQLDARMIWRLKRLAPSTYTRGLGLLNRLNPLGGTAS